MTSEQSAESARPCPPAARCGDQTLCPPVCGAAGNREGNRKRCYWCGKPATGTAMAPLYENGRYVSRMGGRLASCGDHGFGWLMWSDPKMRLLHTPPATNPTPDADQ